jgi:hypothetical protein
MRAMATPLLIFEGDLDARTFTLMHHTAQGHQQQFNVCKTIEANVGLANTARKVFRCFVLILGMLSKSAIMSTPINNEYFYIHSLCIGHWPEGFKATLT